jgi:hypothetical protein
MFSRPVPQSSIGRLVSLSVDNPQYYTRSDTTLSSQSTPPQLIPISEVTSAINDENGNSVGKNVSNDNEEKTMLWRNIANLFTKYDNLESALQQEKDATNRCTDDVYQELQEVQGEIERLQSKVVENTMLSTHVRKIRKYVNKKCEKMKDDINYGTTSVENEIFAYVDKLRTDFDSRINYLEDENNRRQRELSELNDTYYRDYEMFVERENNLMSKLNSALRVNEDTNERLKHVEESLMRQVRMVREEMEQLDYTMAGDLREEFARAITKELSIESNDSTQLIENVNRELLDLVTRSNEYHSYRYFEMVQEVKQIRENCETLKKSIGMVDAELSDVKETVEHLTDEVGHNTTDIGIITDDIAEVKDDMYHELDRDYYDLKDYVKRQMHRHQKKYHHLSYYDENTTSTSSATAAAAPDTTSNREDVIQFTAEQYADPVNEIIPEGQIHSQNRRNEDEHLIIIDENTFHSDTDDEDVIVSHT